MLGIGRTMSIIHNISIKKFMDATKVKKIDNNLA